MKRDLKNFYPTSKCTLNGKEGFIHACSAGLFGQNIEVWFGYVNGYGQRVHRQLTESEIENLKFENSL